MTLCGWRATIKSMQAKRYAKHLVLAVALAGALAGCASGPAIRLGLDFQQGPSFKVEFAATPLTNAASPTLAPVGAKAAQ